MVTVSKKKSYLFFFADQTDCLKNAYIKYNNFYFNLLVKKKAKKNEEKIKDYCFCTVSDRLFFFFFCTLPITSFFFFSIMETLKSTNVNAKKVVLF